MNRYSEFFDYVEEISPTIMPESIRNTFEEIKAFYLSKESKPLFTEAGLCILEYLQSCGIPNLKAKDIAEGIDCTSRKVSGAIRKLVTDGFVDKHGQSPVIYNLTEQGKNFNINNYKENIKK